MVSRSSVKKKLLKNYIPKVGSQRIEQAVFQSIKELYPEMEEDEAWVEVDKLKGWVKCELEEHIKTKKRRGDFVKFRVIGDYLVPKEEELEQAKEIENLLSRFRSPKVWPDNVDRNTKFEEFCKRVLEELGFDSVKLTPHRDGGIDIETKLTLSNFSEFFADFSIDVHVEVKNRENINPGDIRSLGANVNKGEIGVFMSQVDEYTSSQKETARDQSVFLINKGQLIEIIRKNKNLQKELEAVIPSD